jgi:hypothetical protein
LIAPDGAATQPKTSSALAGLAAQMAGRDVPISSIVAALEDRGFGLLMILFALPNAFIPGLSFILGAPVLILALQLAAGRKQVWLPPFLERRTLPESLFQKIAARSQTFLEWVERRLRPRWDWLFSGWLERALGLYTAVVAAFLMMPVPFGNLLPALGISVMSAGLMERDGRAVIFGAVLGFLGCLYILAAAYLGIKIVSDLLPV